MEEAMTDSLFLGSKITADGDSSHEIKRCLLLGRKPITNLDNVVKSRQLSIVLIEALYFRKSEK